MIRYLNIMDKHNIRIMIKSVYELRVFRTGPKQNIHLNNIVASTCNDHIFLYNIVVILRLYLILLCIKTCKIIN